LNNLEKWLKKIGLEQYISIFAENDIDDELLPELGEPDLKEMGMSLGHRKRLLKALRETNSGYTSNPLSTTPISNKQENDPTSGNLFRYSPGQADYQLSNDASEPEKRFLSLMFCDLADSTRITAALDMEDMHALNREYQSVCSEAICKFNGYVARYMGDGILAYFGYPTANEDDAEHAVWAGLEIVSSMKSMRTRFNLPEGLELSVRIGIATGPVVVESIGEGTSGENAVVGEAPNLAARMEGLAMANSIVVGPDTHRLVEKTFALKNIGAQSIKGYSEPLETWQVCGPLDPGDRSPTRHKEHLTSLIGRDEEQTLLQSRWERSLTGEGQIVLLSGEAGIGKTRLIDSLLENILEPHQQIRIFCSQNQSQSPLYPFIAFILRTAGVIHGDTRKVSARKLTELLRSRFNYSDSLLQTILSLASVADPVKQVSDCPDDNREQLDPQHSLQLLQEKIVDSIITDSGYQPVLLVIEDTHWIDATSKKVLDLLVERTQFKRIMMLASFRIEKPLSYSLSNVTNLSLSNLTRNQSNQMVQEIMTKSDLPASKLLEISEKSAGIPLFLEEVSKSVLSLGDTGPANSESDSQSRRLTDMSDISIPDTLQASLLSTLDRLGEAKFLAQCGSVIGNTFEKSLLSSITNQRGQDLETRIQSLILNRITVRESGGENYRLRFRHALLRDAAYESILKKNRMALHGMIADYLSGRDPENARPDLALIAYHYEKSTNFDKAFVHWLDAGESALNSGATLEASQLLENALAIVPYTNQDNIKQLDMYRLSMFRGRALNASRGAVSREAHESFNKAVSIATKLKDISKQVDALDYLFGITINSGAIRKSLEPARKMLQIGKQSQNLIALISGHQGLGMSYCTLGEFDLAKSHLDAALNLSEKNLEGINCYPSMTLDYLSYVKFFMGDREQANELCNTAISSARSESEYATAIALSNSCFTQMMLKNYKNVLEISIEAMTLSRQRGQLMVHGRSLIFNNLARASLENDSKYLDRAISEIEKLYQAAEFVDLTYMLGMTAELQIRFGNLEDATITLDRGLALSTQNEENFYRPELLRLKGQLENCRGGKDSATRALCWLNEGLQLADSQNAMGPLSLIHQTIKQLNNQ
jgi:predicted ATPase/class 3 adenylate cyclase